jgi:hypothetical protein
VHFYFCNFTIPSVVQHIVGNMQVYVNGLTEILSPDDFHPLNNLENLGSDTIARLYSAVQRVGEIMQEFKIKRRLSEIRIVLTEIFRIITIH